MSRETIVNLPGFTTKSHINPFYWTAELWLPAVAVALLNAPGAAIRVRRREPGDSPSRRQLKLHKENGEGCRRPFTTLFHEHNVNVWTKISQ